MMTMAKGFNERLQRHPKMKIMASEKTLVSGKYIALLVDNPYLWAAVKNGNGFKVDLIKLASTIQAKTGIPVRAYYFNGIPNRSGQDDSQDKFLQSLRQAGYNVKLLPFIGCEQSSHIVAQEIAATMRDLDADPNLKAILLASGSGEYYPTIGRIKSEVRVIAYENSISNLLLDMGVPILSLDKLRPDIEKDSCSRPVAVANHKNEDARRPTFAKGGLSIFRTSACSVGD